MRAVVEAVVRRGVTALAVCKSSGGRVKGQALKKARQWQSSVDTVQNSNTGAASPQSLQSGINHPVNTLPIQQDTTTNKPRSARSPAQHGYFAQRDSASE